MRTLMAVLTLGCFFALAGLAVAGPFGTEMGQTPEQFKGLTKENIPVDPKIGSQYVTNSLPKTNPLFQNYTLIFGKVGLAKVIAKSKFFLNDINGNEIKKAYAQLKEQLTKKYGEPKSYDFLHADSKWSEEKDFLMSLSVQERTLLSIWDKNLPDNISTILLQAVGLSPLNGALYLSYEYENFPALADEFEKAAEDAL